MIRKYLFPVLAVLGIGMAIATVWRGSQPTPIAPPVAEPATAPFPNYVAGAGIIETATENIAIAAPVPALVLEVYAKPGQKVQKGDPLFKLDDRQLAAQRAVARTNLKVAADTLDRLHHLPRAEDVPPADAKVREAEGQLADAKNRLALLASVPDKRAISQEDLDMRRFAVDVAQARLDQAQTQLALLKAGAWKPDVQIAEAQVAAATAQMNAIETDIQRMLVAAPVTGEVLQVKVRPGEYAGAVTGGATDPLILMGQTQPLHVRVDVDENDAWRIAAGAKAHAYVRGNRDIGTPLRFVRFEPYVIPKHSLTGDSVERVDTRVLQVIYAFDKGDLPLYVGQLMDVYIEAKPVATATTAQRGT